MDTQQPNTSNQVFTSSSDARLTFIIGIVLGISIMTLGGIAFFAYVFTGGEVPTYTIEPLEPTAELLTEPVGEIQVEKDVVLAAGPYTAVYGAEEDYAVTLVMYVDYECRFCKRFFPEVRDFVNAHADTVRLLVKQYPLTKIHPNAKMAARYAMCSVQQGLFDEWSTRIYDKQNELSDELMRSVSEEIGLDVDALDSCILSTELAEKLEEHAIEAQRLQIRSQPNLVVWYASDNVELIDGYVNASFLESELSGVLTAPVE